MQPEQCTYATVVRGAVNSALTGHFGYRFFLPLFSIYRFQLNGNRKKMDVPFGRLIKTQKTGRAKKSVRLRN